MKEYNFDKIWDELDRLGASKLITKKIFLMIVRKYATKQRRNPT